MTPKPHLPLLLIGAAFVVAACSPRDDPSAPARPVSSNPPEAPVTSTAVPTLPDPQAPDGPAGGRDSKASNPKGDLTPQQESTAMPKAGQANNHSSPALDPPQSARSK